MTRPKSTHPINAGLGGRKPLPDDEKRKRHILWLTDDEWQIVEPVVNAVRAKSPILRKMKSASEE